MYKKTLSVNSKVLTLKVARPLWYGTGDEEHSQKKNDKYKNIPNKTKKKGLSNNKFATSKIQKRFSIFLGFSANVAEK